jgi:hypothetical protein
LKFLGQSKGLEPFDKLSQLQFLRVDMHWWVWGFQKKRGRCLNIESLAEETRCTCLIVYDECKIDFVSVGGGQCAVDLGRLGFLGKQVNLCDEALICRFIIEEVICCRQLWTEVWNVVEYPTFNPLIAHFQSWVVNLGVLDFWAIVWIDPRKGWFEHIKDRLETSFIRNKTVLWIVAIDRLACLLQLFEPLAVVVENVHVTALQL